MNRWRSAIRAVNVKNESSDTITGNTERVTDFNHQNQRLFSSGLLCVHTYKLGHCDAFLPIWFFSLWKYTQFIFENIICVHY
jgi:hypothetical protein